MEVGAFEAKNKLSALLDRVEQGEVVTITRHGRAVARLVPASAEVDVLAAQSALQRISDRAIQAGPFNWESLKADRDASRP